MVAMVADAAANGGESRPAERAKETSAENKSWVGVLNEASLDVDTLLEQLRTTGIGAVENIIDESFRQRLVSEADGRFSETSTAEVEVRLCVCFYSGHLWEGWSALDSRTRFRFVPPTREWSNWLRRAPENACALFRTLNRAHETPCRWCHVCVCALMLSCLSSAFERLARERLRRTRGVRGWCSGGSGG
jgi:hypothetical protein